MTKLSREELLLHLEDAFIIAIESVAGQNEKNRLDQALRQIKNLLVTIPEDKEESMGNESYGWMAKDLKDDELLLGTLCRRKAFVELLLSPGWENNLKIVKVCLVEVKED